MRYTDEEMSRILSAHEGGQLVRGGYCDSREWPATGCLNQIAYEWDGIGAQLANLEPAAWFDEYYDREMSTDQLMSHLPYEGDGK